jgi:hypothetical protein
MQGRMGWRGREDDLEVDAKEVVGQLSVVEEEGVVPVEDLAGGVFEDDFVAQGVKCGEGNEASFAGGDVKDIVEGQRTTGGE